MDIPFYYSLKDIQDNYDNDFKNWNKNFPDADERDFLNEIIQPYDLFVDSDNNFIKLHRAYIEDEVSGEREVFIEIDDYCTIVFRKIFLHLDKRGLLDDEKINWLNYYDDTQLKSAIENTNYSFEKTSHEILKYFFDFDHEKRILVVNDDRYKNFGFAVVKIVKWLEDKMFTPNFSLPPTLQDKETESSDFICVHCKKKQSAPPPPKRLSTPVIIAILNELHLFGTLNKKGFNRQSTIDTLYQIIGTNKKNIANYYDSIIKKETKGEYTEEARNFLNSKGI